MSAPLITSAIRSVLCDAPGVFAPVAEHPATEQALTSAYQVRTVPDHSLDSVAACSTRAGDVIRIQRLTREQISDNWYDEVDLLTTAAKLIAAGQREHAQPVVVHLVHKFTAGEAELIKALSEAGDLVINVGITGDPNADDATAAAHALAGLSVPHTDTVELPWPAKYSARATPTTRSAR